MIRQMIFSIFFLSASGVWAAPTCDAIFTDAPSFAEITKALVKADLEQMQKMDSENLSPELIAEANKNTLAQLRELPPQRPNEKLKAISMDQGIRWIIDISQHPVVGRQAGSKYEQPGTSIGYCFGRASYVHLRALQEGYAKEQIKKLWVVGPMNNGIDWAFHVATAIRDQGGEWRVIDPVVGMPVSPEQWFATFQRMSVDKKLRVYVTNPEKFTFALPKYSRVQLGLDRNRQEDWYKGYFKDLMQSFHKKPTATLTPNGSPLPTP